MFSVEIKINGRILSCINCQNITTLIDNIDKDLYEYECYTYKKDLIKSKITHDRSEGIHKLIAKILNQVSKKILKTK